MTRRTIYIVLFVIAGLLLVGAASGWWYLTEGRFPLAGQTHHDFGTVAIVGRTASFEHTFTLRNRTNRTIEIESIRPGCGCTKATPSTTTLAPDATVDIGIRLSLSKAGKKRVNVVLMISDFGPQALWVEAVGNKETALSTTVEHLALVPGEPQTLLFTAAVQSSDNEPAAPGIAAPPGVRVTFVDYAPMAERDTASHRAAHWRGRLEIVLESAPLPDSAQLELELGEARLSIELSERSRRPAPETPPASPPGGR
jgi:hypothetical protein